MTDDKPTNISFADLCYYFDSQERDRLDRGGMGRKSGQILALRERLLALPEAQFDMAIKTLEKMVEGSGKTDSDAQTSKAPKAKLQDARHLFEQAGVARTSTSSSTKVVRA